MPVTLTIAATSHTPSGVPDSYAAVEDVVLVVGIPGVLANDSDPDGRPLTAVLVSGPLHGELTKFAANGSFKYKPSLNYHGPDSFVYRAVAGGVQSAATTVTLTVAPVNDAPVAGDDIYLNDQQQTLNVAAPGVLANDSDVEGDPLTAVLVLKPVHGKVTFQADGSFTYTSNATFDGSDSFTYKASDGVKKSVAATVTITGQTSHPGFVALPDSLHRRGGRDVDGGRTGRAGERSRSQRGLARDRAVGHDGAWHARRSPKTAPSPIRPMPVSPAPTRSSIARCAATATTRRRRSSRSRCRGRQFRNRGLKPTQADEP